MPVSPSSTSKPPRSGYTEVASPVSVDVGESDASEQTRLSVTEGLSAPVRESRRSCCSKGATTRHLKGIKGMLFCAAAGIGFRDLIAKGAGELVAFGTKTGLTEQVDHFLAPEAQINETQADGRAAPLAVLAATAGSSFTLLGAPAVWHASSLVAHATGASNAQRNVLIGAGVSFGYLMPLVVPGVHAWQAAQPDVNTTGPAGAMAGAMAGELAKGWSGALSTLAGRLTRDSFNALMRGVFNGVKPVDPVTGKALQGQKLAQYDAIRLSGATLFYAGLIFTHLLCTRDALSDATGADDGARVSAVLAEGADGFLGVIACILASCALGCKLDHDDNSWRGTLENLGVFHTMWTQKAKAQLAGASSEKLRQTCKDNLKNTARLAFGGFAMRQLLGQGVDVCVNEAARAEKGSPEQLHWLIAASLLAAPTELRGWLAQNGMEPLKELMSKLPGLPASGSAVAPPAQEADDDDAPHVELLSPMRRRSSAAPEPVDEAAVDSLRMKFWQDEAARVTGAMSSSSSSSSYLASAEPASLRIVVSPDDDQPAQRSGATLRRRPLTPGSGHKGAASPSSSASSPREAPLSPLDSYSLRPLFPVEASATTPPSRAAADMGNKSSPRAGII